LVVKIKKEVIDKCRQFEESRKNIYMYGFPEYTHPPFWFKSKLTMPATHENGKEGS